MKRWEVAVNLVEACNNGKSLTQFHSLSTKLACNSQNSIVASKPKSMCHECIHFEGARKLFEETPQQKKYSWNNILKSYCRVKKYKETLSLFSDMFHDQKPDNFAIAIAVKACAGSRALDFGKMVHGFVKKNDTIGSNLFVGSALIELYSKCGSTGDALRVFEEYAQPDIVLWTTMVTGFEQNGDAMTALTFFTKMTMVEPVHPDRIMLVSVVSACSQSLNLKAGKSVHGFVIRMGFDSGLSLPNALLHLYAKTGCVNSGANLFRIMKEKDVISWGSMICCYAHNEAAGKALDLFREMINERVEPNSVTVIGALQACEATCNLEEGKKIHEIAVKNEFELDVLVSTALIDMYMKCASPDEAVELFRRMPKKDAVCWAALLCGCVHNRMAYKSMGIFCSMLSSGVQPDAVSIVKILSACSELGILQQAFCLHGLVIKHGFSNNAFVGASLIESYSKCSSLDNAIKVFKGINERDVVIWSSMVAGYGLHGRGQEALELFGQMIKNTAIKPNDVTFLSILSACSHAGLVEEGIEIFNMMVHEYQLIPNSKHYGILVDLLGRTGELNKAIALIKEMAVPCGPHIWGALLGACRIHQNTEMGEVAARNLFKLDPDHAGYYICLSHIYAGDGKWDDMMKLRTLVKDKTMKKMSGQSMIEV